MNKSKLNLHIISRAQAKEFGLMRYFTGTPCKRGHIDDRLTSTGVCRECSKVSGRVSDKKRRSNASRKDYMKEYLSKYTQPMKNEKGRDWYRRNAESERARSKVKRENNAGYYQMKCAERRVRIKQQTPVWLDKEKVAKIYEAANRMNLEVDHVVPINSKLVCGLHTWDNLQLLNREENARKLNISWPDMCNTKDAELIAMVKEFY
ncbi:hypothetical protein NVP1265O_70, partial [Vibrio phage 1.265.O._10N.286.52.F6]